MLSITYFWARKRKQTYPRNIENFVSLQFTKNTHKWSIAESKVFCLYMNMHASMIHHSTFKTDKYKLAENYTPIDTNPAKMKNLH